MHIQLRACLIRAGFLQLECLGRALEPHVQPDGSRKAHSKCVVGKACDLLITRTQSRDHIVLLVEFLYVNYQTPTLSSFACVVETLKVESLFSSTERA